MTRPASHQPGHGALCCNCVFAIVSTKSGNKMYCGFEQEGDDDPEAEIPENEVDPLDTCDEWEGE